MSGDVHVRFRERLGVRFPRATRLVIGFERRDDAERVMDVLPKRLGRYGLTLHADKTRVLPWATASTATGGQRSGLLRLLGVHAALATSPQRSLGHVV